MNENEQGRGRMDDQCVLADLEWVASGNGSTSVQTLGVKEDTDPFS